MPYLLKLCTLCIIIIRLLSLIVISVVIDILLKFRSFAVVQRLAYACIEHRTSPPHPFWPCEASTSVHLYIYISDCEYYYYYYLLYIEFRMSLVHGYQGYDSNYYRVCPLFLPTFDRTVLNSECVDNQGNGVEQFFFIILLS